MSLIVRDLCVKLGRRDVLTGIIAALRAQGLPAFDAARAPLRQLAGDDFAIRRVVRVNVRSAAPIVRMQW